MLTVNFNKTLNNMEGLPMQTQPEKDKKMRFVLLKDVVLTALTMRMTSEDLDFDKKASLYALSRKIFDAKENAVQLTCDEVVMIKTFVGKVHDPVSCGRIAELLDAAEAGVEQS